MLCIKNATIHTATNADPRVRTLVAVSYTHLDVYKRQSHNTAGLWESLPYLMSSLP